MSYPALKHVRDMPRSELIAWCVERYGKTHPSPDDLLSARWPQYDKGDRIHVEGWHAMADEIMAVIDAKKPAQLCKACGKALPMAHGQTGKNQRYCGPECRRQGLRRHVEQRRCEWCGKQFSRKVNEPPIRWAKRRFCGAECSQAEKVALANRRVA